VKKAKEELVAGHAIETRCALSAGKRSALMIPRKTQTGLRI